MNQLRAQLAVSDRRTIVLWALSLSADTVQYLSAKYPDDMRPLLALAKSRAWAQGKIKMPEAKEAILACHAMAKELQDYPDACLCHAVAQGCSTVHTPKHALGYPIYALTALAYQSGMEKCDQAVEEKCSEYVSYLKEMKKESQDPKYTWASFLSKETLQ